MSYETITYEKEGHKAVVTLDRPEVMNAFNRQMQDDLKDVWARVQQDRDVWVIIITGAGQRAFCSGADGRAGPRPTTPGRPTR